MASEQMGGGLIEFCFQQSLERNKAVGGGDPEGEWSLSPLGGQEPKWGREQVQYRSREEEGRVGPQTLLG